MERFYEREPYSLNKEEKETLLCEVMSELTQHHREHCREYANYLDALHISTTSFQRLEEVPFFQVRMFKEYELLSIDPANVFKTMTSSGTTGQKVSKIFVDKENAMAQQKTMMKILSDFWGKKRLPLLLIDSPQVMKNRQMFSARGAAIIGLQMMAKETVFALHEDMSLNVEAIETFLHKYKNQPMIMFGFTFLVWQHLYQALRMQPRQWDFSQAYLMTGGGWKTLEAQAVSRETFQEVMRQTCQITRFLDHYGMVEQTGCIYAECECGHLHASIYSDVLIRNPVDFSTCAIGEKGIVQVLSVLPHAYPGHSLLTEDEGVILGEDDCPCGRKGKYIQILGRMKRAELRGCSDTYAESM